MARKKQIADEPQAADTVAFSVPPTVHQITLNLDALDAKAILEAMEVRVTAFKGCLPDGGGNLDGRVIAEICRGWLEMLRMPRHRAEGKAKAAKQKSLLPEQA